MWKEAVMYLWIKQGSEQEATALGFRVEKDDVSGLPYVPLHSFNVCDPTRAPLSPQLVALVDRVTELDSIHSGFRKDGIYRRDGCELVAKKHLNVSLSLGDDTEKQELSISGPTVEAVDEMYSLFREGKLGEPDVDWEPPNARQAENSEVCDLLREILGQLQLANEGLTELIAKP
jgi:hypothetical protein